MWDDGNTRFTLSDNLNLPSGKNYYINGSQIAAANLSDGANLAHINASESISGNWSHSGTLTLGGTLAVNAQFTLGNNGATGEINTNDWDISTTGALTGIGAITSDGLITTSGGLTVSAGDILVSNGDLDLSGGDFNVVLDAGDGVNISKGAAPTADVFTINGGTSATAGVDALQLTFTASGVSGTVVDIDPAFTSTGTGHTFSVIDIDAFTAAISSGSGTEVVKGMAIGNLTQTEGAGTITASALTIGTGWDNSITIASGVVTVAPNTALTTAIDLSDTDIVNAISIGTNVILGGDGATINFEDFDVAADGSITVAAGTGLDTNAGGALYLGDTSATSIGIGSTAVTAITLTTDGTGTGEIVLPASAIGAAEIVDITRSINLPLVAFYNVDGTNHAAISESSAGTQVIFSLIAEGIVVLRWTSGDTDPAGTTMMVPQDYASGGTFHAVVKGAGTQDNDLECKVDVQVPGGAASATMEAAAEGGNFDAAAGANLVAVTFTPANADEFADGAAVNVSIARTGGTDTVDLYGFEFRYTADQ